MLSLNVPVPGAVQRLAGSLYPTLAQFDSVRERHTLVCKRLDEEGDGGRDRIEGRVRQALAGTPAFEAKVTEIDQFKNPTSGAGPVVYLAIESPGLRALHEELVDTFGQKDGVEGDAYTPHITLARGGPPEALERLLDESIDPVTWTVSELWFYDGRYRERVGTVSLPA